MSIGHEAPPMTAAEHRAEAAACDRAAVHTARSSRESRALRRAAQDHRLAALMAAYRLDSTG